MKLDKKYNTEKTIGWLGICWISIATVPVDRAISTVELPVGTLRAQYSLQIQSHDQIHSYGSVLCPPWMSRKAVCGCLRGLGTVMIM